MWVSICVCVCVDTTINELFERTRHFHELHALTAIETKVVEI